MSHKRPNGPPPKGVIGPRVLYLSKQLKQAFNEISAEQGLFSGQQDIVFALNEKEGITIGELAEKINVSAATASVSVKRMEKSGFVKKMPDDKDARIYRLYPTEKAKNAPEIIRGKMESLEAIMTNNMKEGDSEYLTDLLDIAINNLIGRGEDV